MEKNSKLKGLGEVKARRRYWKMVYGFWWITHYGVGLIGIGAGAIAGGSLLSNDETWASAPGIVAAVSTSLLTFLGAHERADRYWKAYHKLDQAWITYELQLSTLDMLCASLDDARTELGYASTDDSNRNEEFTGRSRPRGASPGE